jgi:GNAT superfamily N-acetyltransferase
MSETTRIRGLEERACNAWPALQTVVMDGWLVRFSEGYTKRANSACALAPGAAPLERIGPAIEALYGRAGLPAIFRLTPLATAADAAWLAARGYRPIERTHIMTASANSPSGVDPAIRLSSTAGPDWLAGFAAGNRYGPAVRPTLEKMLAAIRPEAAFAVLEENGKASAYGLCVIERGIAGLFDILVDEAARRRGLGRRVVSSLMAHAAARGAGEIYLQVMETNEAARRLYAELGLSELYAYEYWVV